jgi:hypothetical protein
VPSDRVIVPRSLAFAPPMAVSVPVAGTGGQAAAHAPEQADMFMPSFAHRYTARPDPSVKNVPAEPAWVVITVPVADALAELPAAGAELAGAEGGAAAALPHAAAASTATSGTASLTGSGIRASNEWIIFIVPLGRPPARHWAGRHWRPSAVA